MRSQSGSTLTVTLNSFQGPFIRSSAGHAALAMTNGVGACEHIGDADWISPKRVRRIGA